MQFTACMVVFKSMNLHWTVFTGLEKYDNWLIWMVYKEIQCYKWQQVVYGKLNGSGPKMYKNKLCIYNNNVQYLQGYQIEVMIHSLVIYTKKFK